jgi:hypothetical protein
MHCNNIVGIQVSVIVPLVVVACSPKGAQNDAEQTYALRLYPSYDVTRLDQCMDVCKSCRGGNAAFPRPSYN